MSASPAWISDLADLITTHLQPVDPLAPLGCHHYFDESEQIWEITLFVGNTRVIGGPCDGRDVASRFIVDLLPVARAFDTIDTFQWQTDSAGPDDELGGHMAIRGRYHGHDIRLRLCAEAPGQFEPAREIRVYEQRMIDLW